MSVIPKLLAKRVSETTVTIVDSSRLSYYPITDWDVRVIIVLWVLFFITLVFVVLRLYSRVRVLQFYALEDYLYNIAFTILLAYNAIITFYSYHGLGSQLLSVMTTSDVHLAVVFENVLFDLASVGLLMAKSSLISFLMRLVPQHQSVFRWRVLIMGPLLALAVVSFGAMMAMWARCFGELNGTSALCTDITQAMHWMQVAAGVSVAVDLWYAAMPWYLLHRLTRPRKEKWLVQGSMSLGVLAAGCGIGRALSVYPAANNTDAKSAAILYLWHGAEMAVTMICIGVPVCRPAVNSMLQAVGIRFLALHPSSSKDRRNNTNSNAKGNYPQTTSSYIRNFGQNATWEEAVGATDVDSWSQRRILGVGDTTSGATSGGSVSVGDNIHGGGSRGGSGGAVEFEGVFGADAKEFGLGYPMRSLSKSGITVTKTVDVTNGSKDSPRL